MTKPVEADGRRRKKGFDGINFEELFRGREPEATHLVDAGWAE
jgi:hypothetical protein